MSDKISLEDIQAARARIAEFIQPLRIAASQALSSQFDSEIMLAHEYLQTTGAFKLRGAMNSVLQLAPGTSGVTAVSTGNHGRGLAYSARQAGVPCIICMSELVPQNKLEGIRALGAETRIIGNSQDEAEIEARRLVNEEGYTMIPPFDHPHIIAGQGTLGLEMLEQVPEVDTVLVQLSGGGLISGIALAIKAQKPDVRIVGISMERGAAMAASQHRHLDGTRRGNGSLAAGGQAGRSRGVADARRFTRRWYRPRQPVDFRYGSRLRR